MIKIVEIERLLGEVGLPIYLRKIEKLRLTPEEELKLQEKIINGDKAAVERLKVGTLWLVPEIAYAYKDFMEYNDLIRFGNKQLVKASEKFDYTYDWCFSTYARRWVKFRIRTALKGKRAVHIPNDMLDDMLAIMFKYDHIRDTHQKNGEYPPIEDIAEKMKINPNKLREIINEFQEADSTNSPIADDDSNFKDFILEGNPDPDILSKFRTQVLNEIL